MKKLPLTLSVSALALGLVLTGCTAETPSTGGDTAPSTSSSPAAANAGDEMFVTMMIPHHQQAIEMADLAESRAESQEVKDLAADIEAAQRLLPSVVLTDDALLQIAEVCAALGVSKPTYYVMIEKGQIRTVAIGRRQLVPATELERLLAGDDGAA